MVQEKAGVLISNTGLSKGVRIENMRCCQWHCDEPEATGETWKPSEKEGAEAAETMLGLVLQGL